MNSLDQENNEVEDELIKEKLYLLDESQFLKFAPLLENKKNIGFLEKVKSVSLIYGKRFYPITNKELIFLKEYIKKIIAPMSEIKSGEIEQTKSNEIEQQFPTQSPAISNTGEIYNNETIQPTTSEREPSVVETSKNDLILPDENKPSLTPLKLKQDIASANKLGAVTKLEEKIKITCFWKPQNWTSYKPR